MIKIACNGTILDKEKIEYLSSEDNNIIFGVSIDGGREVHDDIRKDKSGEGTYDKIINNCKKIDYNRFGVAVTLTGKHPQVKDIFLDLYNKEFTDTISINPVRLSYDNEYSINSDNIFLSSQVKCFPFLLSVI